MSPAVTDQLADLVRTALADATEDGVLPERDVPVKFERPRRREHGDWASNVALEAAGGATNPRALAEQIVARLPESPLIDHVDVAGPGFLNFHLSPRWLYDVVSRAADAPDSFARSTMGAGTSVNVEYVSANPTGPVNVVSGRHAAVGDAIANLLEATGHKVTREYYINDWGRQIRLFAQSVAARYLQEVGVDAELPEEGYKGDYLIDVAREIRAEIGDEPANKPLDELTDLMYELAVPRVLEGMRRTLERFGTHFDVWFSQRSLHEDRIQSALDRLAQSGATEERDGALWLRSSQFGDDKDRVLVRSSGEPTYLGADAAYLIDKFERGSDRLIYLWGSDHHGTVARLRAAAQALGYAADRVEVLLMQKVSLSGRTGSKRAGIYVRLDELIDEVGVDPARYTFLTRSIDAPLDFDIELVKQQAPENPVYYVQYAHARISSILRKAKDEGASPSSGPSLHRLVHESELRLMRRLASYEEVVPEAAAQRAPQKIAHYAEELASDFSAFYRDCRVVSDDSELTGARLTLCVATRNVIADALGILGVSAPERM
jgi:arginyl-tRNA synthetase